MRAGHLIAGLAVVASVVGAPSASAAEGPTPQAVAANAEFLAYAPPPPVPAKVCVVDTGVDLTTDAAPAVVERHSVFGGTTDDVGGSGLVKHGTLVAGVIASQLDGRDSVGIWPHARIVSVRVFAGGGGGTTTAAVLSALDLCRERRAQVVNLSLSGLDLATADELAWLEDHALVMRQTRGLNIVAGAGNNAGPVGYPARFAAVLAVGAHDAEGRLCGFSNRGPDLDIVAPGCDVELSWPGGGTGGARGTSYATPVVSAVLAALRAYRPDLSAEAAEALLLSATREGQLNAVAAFRAADLGWLLGSAKSSEPPPVVEVAAPTIVPTLTDDLAALGVRRPRVRAAAYSRRVLSIRLARIPDYARAIFNVDGRVYTRADGRLHIRLRRAPKRVTAAINVPGVGRTQATRIRVRQVRPRPSAWSQGGGAR